MFLTIEQIAKVVHELNRAYCAVLGDDSQPMWEIAPEWQRKSAIDGVRAIVIGVVSSPEDSHKNWLALKLSEGWTYGELKDPVAKTHPCMKDFYDLPLEQQTKDRLFYETVHLLLDAN